MTRLGVEVADAVRVLQPELPRVDARARRAVRDICISIANDADVTPKPRMAVVGTWFVQTT